MKLGLLPLFRPESFTRQGFSASGLEYFSANSLAEIAGFVTAHFPEIQVNVKLSLRDMLSHKPDLVLLWAMSTCFGQVQPTAESLKTYLGIPVWLGGPHISYLPQSLPQDVDLGIIGEVELPLQQLLAMFLKHPELGPMQYRKVPGVIYQSKGRMYSGSPAQIVPQLSQLPPPDYSIFRDLQGFTAPVVRSARVSDSMLMALAYPPSRKPRLQHPEQICQQISQIADNYTVMYRQLPVPPQQLMYLSPVFIPDYAFLQHRTRLDALIKLYREQRLHERVFLIPNLYPEAATPALLMRLALLNTRKVLLQMGPFGHSNPLLPAWTPEQLDTMLELCRQQHFGVIGQLYLNPDVSTHRSQLADTYFYLRERLHSFERFSVSALGVFPGTPVWEQYAAKTRPDAQALAEFPWASLDFEKYASDLPLYHSQLDRSSLSEIYWAFERLIGKAEHISQPITQDIQAQAQQEQVREFVRRYLRPGESMLEIPLQPEMGIKSLLRTLPIEQMSIQAGQLAGAFPAEPVDLILLSGTLNALRDPETALRQLKASLKPDGRLFVHWLNPLYLGTLVGFLRWKPERSGLSNPILKFLRQDQMEAMLRRCGFEPLETDYTIMGEVETARPTVEALAARLEHHGSLRIPQHMLYISEIKMLARNRS